MSAARLRAEGRRLVEVAALTTLAVAQPVLDSFGQSPETFVFLGQSQPVEIIRFALIVLIVPAVALWAAGVAVGLFGRPARLVAHQVTLGVLARFERSSDLLAALDAHGAEPRTVATDFGRRVALPGEL